MYRNEQQFSAPPSPVPRPDDHLVRHEAATAGYYGLPSLKESPYHWKTALSFLAEALGGGPQLLAALISLAGNAEDRNLVRASRYLALAGAIAGPALLVSELHTPRRWLNMLRIFRPTSAMSIGNLSLTSFGIFSGLTASLQVLEDLGRIRQDLPISRICSLPAALAGAMICLYPGTELEETSVPLWAGSHPLLAPLFAATGLSAGAAALTVVTQRKSVTEGSRDRLNDLAAVILAGQLAVALLVENVWRTRGFFFLRDASRGAVYRLGVIGCGIFLPLVLRLMPESDQRRRRGNRRSAAAATLAGAYLTYEVVLEAGNNSAGSATEYLRETKNRRRTGKPGRAFKGMLGLTLLAAAGTAMLLLKRRSSP